ncbi:hypothetical protein WCP94_000431 (plasmid) [Bilophila wadsworthia]
MTDGDGDFAQQSVTVNTVAGPCSTTPLGGSSVVPRTKEHPRHGVADEKAATQPFGAATDGSFQMQRTARTPR